MKNGEKIKISLIVVTIFVLLISLMQFNHKIEKYPSYDASIYDQSIFNEPCNDLFKIEVTTEAPTIDSHEVYWNITNVSDTSLSIESMPYLEIKIDDKWYTVPMHDMIADGGLSHSIMPSESYKSGINLDFFKVIGAGKYRAVQKISGNRYITIEFNLEK